MKNRSKHNQTKNMKNEIKLEESLDYRAEFDEWRATLPEMLRKDLAAGMTTDAIYAKYQNMAAARAVVIATTETDTGKALSAIKDILDRAGGKAKEKSEITHKYEELKEDQLDALLLTKLKDRGFITETH